MAWTVYCHTHAASGRRYIGLTKHSMLKRWNRHVYSAMRGKNDNFFFANAIRKYGKEAFTHQVLEVCETLEEANEAERDWIRSFSTQDPVFGFNVMGGGFSPPQRTPVRTAQARAANKASLNTPESKARRIAASKLALSDPEIRNKISQAAKEHASTPAGRMARSNAAKSMTPEARALATQKTAEKLKGRTRSEEHRTKISSTLTGRQLTEDHKTNLRKPSLVKKTHCKHGHSLEDAWIRKSNGARLCRICNSRK